MTTPATRTPATKTPPPDPALPAESLRWRCDPETLGFASTDDVPPLVGTAGQDRGLDAINLGLAVENDGFNVFVAGPPGSGRTTTARYLIAQTAASRAAPSDWCYLHNFQTANQPIALELAAGQAPEVSHDLEDLIGSLRRAVPRVFEAEEYQQRRAEIARSLDARRDAIFAQIRAAGEQLGFAVEFTPMGAATVPLLEPGKPMSPEAFELLPDQKKAEIRAKNQELRHAIEEALMSVHRLEREAQERLHKLDHEVMGYAVGHLLAALQSKYAEIPAVVQHLESIQADLVSRVDEFHSSESEQAPRGQTADRAFDRYRANVLVTHSAVDGAPVVFEPNPTYYNLVGRINYRASIGAMYTDFTLIQAGALHRANGGYLIVQARDVLLNPFAWDALKRALRDHELRIENLGEEFSAFPTASLKPARIPLHVKVVLIGDVQTYMLLYQLDPDFQRLFKIKAHFGPTMPRTEETVKAYAGFVSGHARARNLLPFGSDAVARVIEHGARLAEHQDRLATRFEAIGDLLVEADQLARQERAAQVRAAHVETALVNQEHRVNLLEEEIQREIDEQTLAIDTHAQVVGQVNGLSVMELGDYAFSRPSRITAMIGLGDEGVVDIEREVKMSGPSHSKGVMILTGYLLNQYAHDAPLALSARLTFEQVYGAVDGDSASSTELYALLSALGDLPIHQGIAVTGSVNQRGEVQAIGGVNLKIEGFYAVCRAQGLSGQQGVIIPASNARHLMLKPEVVDAVKAGLFHVWAVRTVDEGITLLTGVPADRVHDRVQQRLRDLASRLMQFRGRRDPAAANDRTSRSNGHDRVVPSSRKR
ncbi:MAG TPA: AAA family ATPase [Chloroflexota bacterium]|jgi:predicted ATP-dependent protease